jgi:hypothetical protein
MREAHGLLKEAAYPAPLVGGAEDPHVRADLLDARLALPVRAPRPIHSCGVDI